MKPWVDEARDFHDKKIRTVDLIVLVWGKYRLILFLKNKNYYLQVLLGECNYIEKEKLVIRLLLVT